MSIGCVSMHEFANEEGVSECQTYYPYIRETAFPTAQLVVNIRKGPTSLLSQAFYPSYESKVRNLECRIKFRDQINATHTSLFYYLGDMSYSFHKQN